MTINAISAQALRPAVNFKKTEAPAGEKLFAPEHKEDSKKTAAKVLGGAVALAALGFGVYKFIKNRNAKKLFNRFNPPKGTNLYQNLQNIKSKYEGNRIVENFEKMRKPEDLKTYAKIKQELTHVDWDAKPITKQELLEQLAK